MPRNLLQVVVAALVIAVLVLGYLYYQERRKSEGIRIELGEKGISVQTQ